MRCRCKEESFVPLAETYVPCADCQEGFDGCFLGVDVVKGCKEWRWRGGSRRPLALPQDCVFHVDALVKVLGEVFLCFWGGEGF